MADLSHLSDEELMQIYGKPDDKPAETAPSPLSSMSNEDLRKIMNTQPAMRPAENKPAEPISNLQYAGDIAQSGAIGLAKGGIGLFGLPGDVRQLAGAGADSVGRRLGVSPDTMQGFKNSLFNTAKYVPGMSVFTGPTSGEIQKSIEGVTGDFYKPKTKAGEYAETVGEFAPGALIGPEAIGAKVFKQAVLPGVGSKAATDFAHNSAPALEPYAGVIGAVGGALVPGTIRKAITPFTISPERQALLDTLKNEGVSSLTAGQKTGNKTLQYAESALGDSLGAGSLASKLQEQGQRQFTEAAMRRAGTGVNAAPEVLKNNYERLGKQFEDLSARNTFVPDNKFITDIVDASKNYKNVVPGNQQREIVQGYVDDIIPHVNAGQMPGAQYQEMRSRLSRQAQGLRNVDPTLSDSLRDIRNALDEGMGRSISPADKQAWEMARREYGAQKILEKSATGAGEAAAEGQITPAKLRNAVTVGNRGAYARGDGDFAALARAGSGVMAPLPNSGTSQRSAITTLAAMLGGGGGAFVGGGTGATLGAGVGAITASAAPALMGKALMSSPMQAYLANQMLPQGANQISAKRLALITLLASPDRQKIEQHR